MQTVLLILASVAGMSGVGLGAFGAHAFNALLVANDRLSTYQTAVQYHLIHTVALLIVALLAGQQNSVYLNAAGVAFVVGIVLFSGSLYVLALQNLRVMGAVAPFGGIAFVIGWGMILLHAFTVRS
jgi:uncharacterized membrane protein YgdD (TMEM256/DUF423 family)